MKSGGRDSWVTRYLPSIPGEYVIITSIPGSLPRLCERCHYLNIQLSLLSSTPFLYTLCDPLRILRHLGRFPVFSSSDLHHTWSDIPPWHFTNTALRPLALQLAINSHGKLRDFAAHRVLPDNLGVCLDTVELGQCPG